MLAGNVHIILPYHPTFYVRTEEDFNITCVSKNVKLLWYRNTKKYGKVDIYAKNGGKFEMIWTEYHPSWKVQSILIRKDAELSDTGTYTCHDHRNMSTYSTKVTVLHIFTTLSNTSFNISCSIAGFSSNLPNITYTWRVNGSYISPNPTAYSMKANDGRMSIQKTNPVREDSANYECVYTFATNIKVINITKSMHFNGE
ncbi:hypothetical protein LSAT2_005250 [Lamellibrachia satsuma]|nr:hypothetical protein LSAT2_005250 [Lamellibrachia satsuma]